MKYQAPMSLVRPKDKAEAFFIAANEKADKVHPGYDHRRTLCNCLACANKRAYGVTYPPNNDWEEYFGIKKPSYNPGMYIWLDTDEQTKNRTQTYIDNKPKATGFNCTVCNGRNDYAQANQSNGTYICFNCR